MARILSSRIFRCMICLLLICCILVNYSPIKARATGLEGAAIAGASAISVPAAIVICATLIALGVMGKAADTEGTNMHNLVNQAQAHLENVGGWIQNGTIDMVRTVDASGNVMFYASSELFETLRIWLLDSATVSPFSVFSFETDPREATIYPIFHDCYLKCLSYPHHFLAYQGRGSTKQWICGYSKTSSFEFILDPNASDVAGYSIYQVRTVDDSQFRYYESSSNYTGVGDGKKISGVGSITFIDPSSFSPDLGYFTTAGLALGIFSSFPIDGTSAKEWAPDYADKGLYICGGGGPGMDPDDGAEGNDQWKWLLPLSLVALLDLLAMSQADQWTAITPEEFDDYSTTKEYDVTPQPDIDGYPAIEVTPSADPDTDPGSDPDPGTGTNPVPDPWTPPSDMGKFTLDLKQYFPFCIPFDLYAFFTCLNAEPVAPVIEWLIPLPGGKTYPFEIDLSTFDSVAQILRRMQLLLFCVGLAFKTRDLIKG